MKYIPSYIDLFNNGTLEKRLEHIKKIIKSCTLCPHKCNVNRTESRTGKCRSGILPFVSSFNAHFGEESCLVGSNGSGTIFFTNCNLTCIYCQNYDISHLGHGEEISFNELASIMLTLQSKGCHNINFVTPSHMIYAILESLKIAIPQGLQIPLVYNSGGYDSVNTLRLLNGIIDIYMPDFKYMDSEISKKLSGASDYPAIAKEAITEMFSQVGDLLISNNGIATRGLLVRHLVLPNNIAGTDKIIEFLANLSKNTYTNLMDQYRPEYRAREHFDLKRRVSLQEFDEAVDIAKTSGLKRIDGII